MALEIEAKMRLTDRPALETRMAAIGGHRTARLLEANMFYDRREASLFARDEGLRVRAERELDTGDETVIVTHKGPRAAGEVKQRQETELRVAGEREAGELLKAIGFERVLIFEKRRDKWRVDDCEVCVDELPRVGQFVEIEGPSLEAVLAVRERLGLADEPMIRNSYASMVRQVVREGESLVFEGASGERGE